MTNLNASLLVAVMAAVTTAITIMTCPVSHDSWLVLAASGTMGLLFGFVCLLALTTLEDYDRRSK